MLKTVFLPLFLILNCGLSSQVCIGFKTENIIREVLPNCNKSDGKIIFLRTSGGIAPYTYQLDTSTNVEGEFNGLGIGTYQFRINDSQGCIDSVEVTLEYVEIEKLVTPYNTFTPNDDGINDRWEIAGIESYPTSIARVYNRWGQEVHLNSPYKNEFGWDGTQNGLKLPSGTYYYIVTVINNCIEENLSGFVTIIR